MKRILTALLAGAMLFAASSCSSLEDPTATVAKESATETAGTVTETVAETVDKGPIVLPEGFSAGFGRVTVNPQPGTALAGWPTAGNRLSRSILDDIELTCTALCDGDDIFLLYSADTLFVGENMVSTVARMMEETYGIPEQNILMNATHTHSAPGLHLPSLAGMKEYLKEFYPALKSVTDRAIRDLAPAELFSGLSYTKGLNYVRRYVSVKDGSYLGGTSLGNGLLPEIAKHETEADNELRILKLDRAEKKDIVLCNWQCHPTSTGGESSTGVSADWVGALRDEAEALMDVHFSFHQGAGGDLVPGSLIKGETKNGDHIKHGKAIAKVAAEAVANATKIESGPFRANKIQFVGTRKDSYANKNGGKKTETMDLSVLSIGDAAFATAPIEMHDTLGQYVRDNSPFRFTFMCAYTNGSHGYVPSSLAFDNGGYETNSTHFEKGTGEQIAKKLVELLDNLKKDS